MENIVQLVTSYAPAVLMWTGAVVVALTGINAALIPLVKLTKTKRDDAIVAKIDAGLRAVRRVLDRLGVSLPDREK